jgi:hypothetical protein
VDESIARRTAIGIAALIAIIYLASLIVYARIGSWQSLGDWADVLGFTAWISAFTVVGVIIAIHRPGNPVAWLCLGFAGVWSTWILLDGLLTYESAHPGTLVRPDLIAGLAYPLWVPGVALIGFLLLLFPDGRLPSPRWRPVAWLLGGTTAVLTLTGFLLPGVVQDTVYVNPLGIEALEPFDQGIPGMALVVTLVSCILASAVSVLLRYRRAVGSERLQLKWLMAAGLVAALAYALLFVWEDFNIQLVWAAIPVAIGLSMHRHRLYDIDRLISRTVVYAIVVGALAAVFVGAVFLFGQISPFEGDLAVAMSTLTVAAMFNPLRRRVHRWVERRFNRSRFDAERVIDIFAGELRDETDAGSIVDGWVSVVAETMQPKAVGAWVRGPDL